jgi:hypothetical protein
VQFHYYQSCLAAASIFRGIFLQKKLPWGWELERLGICLYPYDTEVTVDNLHMGMGKNVGFFGS